MPAGLDGNPNPVVTSARSEVLAAAAQLVLTQRSDRQLVDVDGRSGAGKSTFADELATAIEHAGQRTLRSTTDSFHRPLTERMRLGPTSAEGYYFESHQLGTIADELLAPFAQGAPRVRVAAFDQPTDTPVYELADVNDPTVLIFDGLFLQRPELAPHWDHVIYLDADTRCDKAWLDYLLTDLPDDPSARSATLDTRLEQARWPRYRHGWQIYTQATNPAANANLVIDNNDLTRPHVAKQGP